MNKYLNFLIMLLLACKVVAYDSPTSVHFSTQSDPEPSQSAQYPTVAYINSDGSTNIFATSVAYLNIAAVFMNPIFFKIGTGLVTKWDADINQSIIERLGDLDEADKNLRIALADIIKRFNNGIGGENDEFITESLIEHLNRRKCSLCIERFVDLVSVELVDGEKRKANREDFGNFVGSKPNEKCDNHQFLLVASNAAQKNAKNCMESCGLWHRKAWHALTNKWNHPFHFSSLSYAFGIFGASMSLPLLLDDDNKAGSYIGDVANFVNILAIPTAYWYSILQHWKNLDREEGKRLFKRIEERFFNIEGILLIGASVIGKMDNSITFDEAYGILEILVLIRCPENMVNDFIKVSSKDRSIEIKEFINQLREKYQAYGFSYRDKYIEAAFNIGSESTECEIYIDRNALSNPVFDEFN